MVETPARKGRHAHNASTSLSTRMATPARRNAPGSVSSQQTRFVAATPATTSRKRRVDALQSGGPLFSHAIADRHVDVDVQMDMDVDVDTGTVQVASQPVFERPSGMMDVEATPAPRRVSSKKDKDHEPEGSQRPFIPPTPMSLPHHRSSSAFSPEKPRKTAEQQRLERERFTAASNSYNARLAGASSANGMGHGHGLGSGALANGHTEGLGGSAKRFKLTGAPR